MLGQLPGFRHGYLMPEYSENHISLRNWQYREVDYKSECVEGINCLQIRSGAQSNRWQSTERSICFRSIPHQAAFKSVRQSFDQLPKGDGVHVVQFQQLEELLECFNLVVQVVEK